MAWSPNTPKYLKALEIFKYFIHILMLFLSTSKHHRIQCSRSISKYKRIFRFITVSFDNSIAGISLEAILPSPQPMGYFNCKSLFHAYNELHSIDWNTHTHRTRRTNTTPNIYIYTSGDWHCLNKYTNIDGHISQKVFNNKLLWLMALDMPLYMDSTNEIDVRDEMH